MLSGSIKSTLPFSHKDWYFEFVGHDTPKAQLVKDIELKMVQRVFSSGRHTQVDYITADQLAMAILLSDDVITRSEELYCKVETTGYSSGMMVVDWRGAMKKTHNVKLVLDINFEKYKNILAGAVI